MSIYLKDLNHWKGRTNYEMIDLQLNAEALALVIQGNGALIRDVATAHVCLRKAEITYKTISVGGRHSFQEPGDCRGEYREGEKGRNIELHKSKKRDASSTIVFRIPGWKKKDGDKNSSGSWWTKGEEGRPYRG